MIYLLDVNLLLAMMDGQHVAHATAHAWFDEFVNEGWASCPITQNGFVRIISNTKYPNPTATPAEAASMLADAVNSVKGHQFWADDVSLLSNSHILRDRLLSPSHITDTYLLALARRHDALLATLDRRLVTTAVKDGAEYLHVIGAAS